MDAYEKDMEHLNRTVGQAWWNISTAEGGSVTDYVRTMQGIQSRFCSNFPRISDEVEFWETLWRSTDRVRDQWDRFERALQRRWPGSDEWKETLDRQRRELYRWMRGVIQSRAPRTPDRAHYELGIDEHRSDYRGLHERIEGLYEAMKRMGKFPKITRDVSWPENRVNVGIIYGGGWNVSTYSVLREAANVDGINAFCTFDHPGEDIYQQRDGHIIRLATAGMFRTGDEEYALGDFHEPVILHFICPHQWAGASPEGSDVPVPRGGHLPSRSLRPHQLGVPLLRSDLTLDIVDDKVNTTRALKWYKDNNDVDLPLIPESTVTEVVDLPADADAVRERARNAVRTIEDAIGTSEVVVKPGFGMEEKGVGYFDLPEEREDAIEHAARRAVESGAVIQQRIVPEGELDYNWRVMVARSPEGEPKVVGRFARLGHHEQMEMVPDRDMLHRVGVTGAEADEFLEKLNEISLNAFRAVSQFARHEYPDFPYQPLGDGSYTDPYFLGMDLIGDGRVMEVNGHEVAGMWTDDRLYPETCGRSNRLVLESARQAGRQYRDRIEECGE